MITRFLWKPVEKYSTADSIENPLIFYFIVSIRNIYHFYIDKNIIYLCIKLYIPNNSNQRAAVSENTLLDQWIVKKGLESTSAFLLSSSLIQVRVPSLASTQQLSLCVYLCLHTHFRCFPGRIFFIIFRYCYKKRGLFLFRVRAQYIMHQKYANGKWHAPPPSIRKAARTGLHYNPIRTYLVHEKKNTTNHHRSKWTMLSKSLSSALHFFYYDSSNFYFETYKKHFLCSLVSNVRLLLPLLVFSIFKDKNWKKNVVNMNRKP